MLHGTVRWACNRLGKNSAGLNQVAENDEKHLISSTNGFSTWRIVTMIMRFYKNHPQVAATSCRSLCEPMLSWSSSICPVK